MYYEGEGLEETKGGRAWHEQGEEDGRTMRDCLAAGVDRSSCSMCRTSGESMEERGLADGGYFHLDGS